MKSKLTVVVLALLLVGGIATAAVALTSSGDDADNATHSRTHGEKHDKAKADKRKHDGAKHDKQDARADKPWKKYWRSLPPAQRADLMARLAQEHADGMKRWATCVKSAGEDRSARATCERPLPPGLAKKRNAR